MEETLRMTPSPFSAMIFAEYLAGKHRSQDVQIEHPAQSIRRKIKKGEIGSCVA